MPSTVARRIPARCIRALCALVPVAAVAADPVLTIPYTVTQDCRVSIAIYNSTGQMVRPLLTAAARLPGSYAITWDGRDRYGAPLPAGTYTWKQASSTGLTAEYITNLGMNHSPSAHPGVGNHSPPQAVAIDSTGLYRIGCWNEGTAIAQKTDLSGNLLWSNWRWNDGWNEYGRALALGDGALYDLGANGTLWGYNTTTGRCFTNDDYDLKPIAIRWGSDADAQDYADNIGMDIAYDPAGHLVVVSYRDRNGIRWFDPAARSWVGQTTAVPAPVSVSVATDGTVFAISQGAVVSIVRGATAATAVIPAGALASPWRISVDPGNGDLWIAENSDRAGGARHHQVKRFSRTGTLLATYGRPDGRQDGAYIATDFRGITDITADGQGGFCVAEKWYAPRRVARFSATGSLVREWYGAQEYGAAAAPEPGDPTHAWFHVNAPDGQIGMVRTKIDLVTKTWSVVETYSDALFDSRAARSVDGPFLLSRRNGLIYIQANSIFNFWLGIYDPVARRVRPCNAVGIAFKDDAWNIPATIRPTDGSTPQYYQWNDLNDDGIATRDEMQWNQSLGGGYVDPNTLAVYTTPRPTGYYSGPIYRPSRITAGGTPVYGASTGTWPAWKEIFGADYKAGDFRIDADGSVYGAISDSFYPGWENHGRWYFNGECSVTRLVKWDATGKQIWSVGRHSSDPDHQPGEQALARTMTGFAKGCVIWSDASDEEFIGAHAYTSDGLWVGELPMVSVGRSPEVIHGGLGNEYPAYRIETDDRTGDVLFFGQTAMGGGPVFRIAGWDGITTTAGTISMAATPAAIPAGTGITAQYWTNPTWTGSPAVTRVDQDVYYDENGLLMPSAVTASAISARWTGRLIARTSGEVFFSIEGEKPYRTGKGPASAVLWVDGRKILDLAAGIDERGALMMKAGEIYDIRLDASFTGVTNGIQIHLCWESADLDRRRIEQRFLLPTGTASERWPGGLQAQWRLDEGAGTVSADASGNGRGLTLAGASWGSGVIAGGSTFAGGTGSASAAVPVSATARTVSLWFRTTATDGGLFSTADAGSGTSGDIWLSGGRILARAGGQTIQTAQTGWNNDAWHHVVHVLGGPEGGQRLYVDGELRAAGSQDTDLPNQVRAVVGRSVRASAPTLVGRIDEVRIYDLALSGRAVRDDLYRREQGLIAYFPCDEGAGVRLGSRVGSRIFATQSGNTGWTTGRFGGGVRIAPQRFIGGNVYADPEVRVPWSDVTVAFWARTSSANCRLFAVDRDSTYNYIIEPLFISVEQGLPVFTVKNLDSKKYGTTRIDDGAWHHIAVGMGAGGTRMYVDGVLAASSAQTFMAYSNRLGFDLGGGSDVDGGSDGSIVDMDEIRVYGRALSAAEIVAVRNLVPDAVQPPETPSAPVVISDGTAGPSLVGTATPGLTMVIRLDGTEIGNTVVGTQGGWRYDLFGFTPGARQATVVAVGTGGSSAPSPAVTVTVGTAADTTPPATPAAPTVSSQTSATPLVSGTTEPGATVRIFVDGVQAATVSTNGSGAWSWTVAPPLSVGVHALTVQAVDAAGNESGVSPATTVNVSGSNLPPTISVPATATPVPLALP
ncbi:MAG: hypothetical protein RLZZ127_1659 [Planctomycetota bacterium]|jgi:hypothetical protein